MTAAAPGRAIAARLVDRAGGLAGDFPGRRVGCAWPKSIRWPAPRAVRGAAPLADAQASQ
jgi:hypothetical protein